MLKLETAAHSRSASQHVHCFSTFPAKINLLARTDTVPIDKIQPAGSASTLPAIHRASAVASPGTTKLALNMGQRLQLAATFFHVSLRGESESGPRSQLETPPPMTCLSTLDPSSSTWRCSTGPPSSSMAPRRATPRTWPRSLAASVSGCTLPTASRRWMP